MSKPLTTEEFETLSFLLKGNRQALKLALDVLYVGHLWDDLIDQDNPRTSEDINSAFLKAFRCIPNNPFFLALPERLRWQLEGLLISAAMQYRDSTHLEMGDQGDRFVAFLIRNAVMAFVHYLIYLVGGDAWVDEHGPEFWRMFSLKDKYLEFVEEAEYK